LKDRGPRRTFNIIDESLAYLLRSQLEKRFDRRFQVDTSEEIELVDPDSESDNTKQGVRHRPTAVKTFRSILSNLPDDLSDFIFVDFGSGKGRTLLLASELNFKKIIGVEFSKELHLIAQDNIHRYRSKKQHCFDIASICMDVVDFPIPNEPSVFYFMAPFEEEIMSKVLCNIQTSCLANPRKILMIYCQQFLRLHHLMQDFGFVRKVGVKLLPIDFANFYRRRLFELSSPYRRGLAIYEHQPSLHHL
jgi:SAM-dependent methyltransferase